MARDKALTPAEAMRLAVLGPLLDQDMAYAELAGEVRRFVERIVGPSLELLGSSLEVLRVEGLIEAVEGEAGADNSIVGITRAGREAFEQLMLSGLRSPTNDSARLVLALKLRYLHHIPPEDRADQLDMFLHVTESELARLRDLQARGGSTVFLEWLQQEIAHVEARRIWLERALSGLESSAA